MGGDFILDDNGVVLYQYPTELNERPTVQELLHVLREM